MNKAEKFWDNRSKHFDSNKKKDTNVPSKTVKSIKKHLNKNDILLDFGCATGSLSIDIAGLVKEVYAIDISSKMIEIAKRKKLSEILLTSDLNNQLYLMLVLRMNLLMLLLVSMFFTCSKTDKKLLAE